MRRCSRCEVSKPVSDFNRKGNGWQSECKACNCAYLRQHYLANRAYYLAKARRSRARQKRVNFGKVFDYFNEHPCIDCGERDPTVLQFDHVRGEKEEAVGRMLASGYAWARIEAEIAKCEVRCSNCHWRRTAKQFKWYAFLGDGGG